MYATVGNPHYRWPDPSVHWRETVGGQDMCGQARTDRPVPAGTLKWLPVCMLSTGHFGEHVGPDPLGSMESVVRWRAAVDVSLPQTA